MNVNTWGNVNQWGAAVGVSLSVTELSSDFGESSQCAVVQAGFVTVNVTEMTANFTDSAQTQITGSFTATVTDLSDDFSEDCYIQLPVIRIEPRKVIRVMAKQRTLIRVR